MAIIEIVLPQLKKDGALIKELEKTVVPVLRRKLQEAGALKAMRGWFATEDGRDVRDQFREILVVEWPTAQDFHSFIASPSFQEFLGKLKEKDVMEGPPVFKLYDPSSSSSEALSSIFKAPRTVLEYLVISPKPTSASEASVQKILQKLQSGLAQLGTTNAVVGESTNLASREIAVFGSYASQTDLDTAKASKARQQLLAEIADTADVTSLVAPISRELPLEGN